MFVDHDMSTVDSHPENRKGESKWQIEKFAKSRHNTTDCDIISDLTKLSLDSNDSNDAERKDSGIVMESGRLDQNSNNITLQDLEEIRNEQSHKPKTTTGSVAYPLQKTSSLDSSELHTNSASTDFSDRIEIIKRLKVIGKSASSGIKDNDQRHDRSTDNLYKTLDGYHLNSLSNAEDLRQPRRGSCPVTVSISCNSSPKTREGRGQTTKKLGCPFASARASSENLGGSNYQSTNSSVQDFFGLTGFRESPLNSSVEGVNHRGLKRGGSFRARKRYNTISDSDDAHTRTKPGSQNKHFLKRIPKFHRPKHFPKLESSIFFKAFPFHIIINRQMRLIQAGMGILKIMSKKCIERMKHANSTTSKIGPEPQDQEALSFTDYFRILSPNFDCDNSTSRITFSWIMDHRNSQFILELKRSDPNATCQSTVGEVSSQVYANVSLYVWFSVIMSKDLLYRM